MDIIKAIEERHSVRSYLEKQIPPVIIEELNHVIEECNKESGLNIQLICNEPVAFGGRMANYGKFSGVSNYIAIVAKSSENLNESIGYYGEKIVLKAQLLGLNTCWVALSFSKSASTKVCKIKNSEKLACVISIGYGKTQGNKRRSKSIEEVSNYDSSKPDWFKKGVEASLLAPTAINQQKFKLIYDEGNVIAKAGMGFYTKMDLGIVKYHFEIGAGKDNFSWK